MTIDEIQALLEDVTDPETRKVLQAILNKVAEVEAKVNSGYPGSIAYRVG